MNSEEIVGTMRFCRRVLLGLARKHGFEILATHVTYTYGNRPEIALEDSDRNVLFIGDVVLPEDAGRPAPSTVALLRSYLQRFQTLQRQGAVSHCVLALISESAETIRTWSDTLDALAAAMELQTHDGGRILFQVESLNDGLWLTWGATNPEFNLLF